jgi:hypothetical protein
MSDDPPVPLAVLAAAEELPPADRVWGTGGWLAPERREALDWLTLARFLGWAVAVIPVAGERLPAACRRIVAAYPPERLGNETVARLAARLAAEPVLVLTRAAAAGTALARLAGAWRRPGRATGRTLSWTGLGPPRRWLVRRPLEAEALEFEPDVTAWAGLDGSPVVVARRVGGGVVLTLALHPSAARDADGTATALLRHLLTTGSSLPSAWLDLEGTLVLRMDDPGGAQNVHSRAWSHRKLSEADWQALGQELRGREGRLSLGYVAGWVDDGDAARGELRIGGGLVPRVPGQVLPSPLVTYDDRAGHAPGTRHDYESEYRGIQKLRAAGLGDVELHGYTHLHPDAAAWARAPDRYETVSWYRELGAPAEAALAALPPEQHPLALGVAALRPHFGVRPTTLICPGDEWTNRALERAHDLGLHLVSSYYQALRDGPRFCWCTHVCAPYLDEPDAAWFDAGLPVVGYFHDRDVAVEGSAWFARCLDGWQAAGARRLLDFRELSAALGRRLDVDDGGGGFRLVIRTGDAPALVRPLPVLVCWPGRALPARLPVVLDGSPLSLALTPVREGVGRLVVPGPGVPAV